MTTIDVNTGGYVGHRNLEETTFRTNLEAAASIGRQLRLRNLGGIIIIDFIDMHDESHRRQVLAALEHSLAGDRAQAHIVSLSPLGLVEMTRKRTRESLEHLLCEPCAACEGRGFVKTPETVCNEISREILRQGTEPRGPRAADPRARGRGRASARGRGGYPRRAQGAGGHSHPAAGRRPLRRRSVRHRAGLSRGSAIAGNPGRPHSTQPCPWSPRYR